MDKRLKDYYKIDTLKKPEGIFELWEHKTLGEYAAAIVTLNGDRIDKTLDDLNTWYSEEWENS